MVEWKNIGEIGSYFSGLTGKTKDDFQDGNAKFITYMNVFSNPSLDVNSTGVVKINEGEKQNKIQRGDVLFTGSSETPDEAGMSCVVTDDLEGDFYMNSFCFGLRLNTPDLYNLHFLKHVLRSDSIRKSIAKTASGVTRFNISKARFSNIQIPIPSLSEQNRIVGILDTFTASIENLKEQITQRRKQFNWYLDKLYYATKADLLDASNKGEVIIKSFDEIGTFTRGRRFVRTDIVPEGVPCIHYGDMYTHYGVRAEETPTHLTKEKAKKLRFATKGDVVIVAAGENDLDIGVGVAWLGEEDVVIHDACFIFKHNMNPKYLSYFMRSMNYHQQIRMGVVDGKICSISAKELGRTLIAVPSSEEQSRIVSILDTFEASIANLEAQLSQREKQYEYYRNKLLTFE